MDRLNLDDISEIIIIMNDGSEFSMKNKKTFAKFYNMLIESGDAQGNRRIASASQYSSNGGINYAVSTESPMQVAQRMKSMAEASGLQF